MSLNYKEINLILSELDLASCFVQDIIQPNFDSIAFYTIKPGFPKTVFVSLASGSCRINETRRKITKNEKPLRFNELLKSKIKGSRIISCEQIGNERIIKIQLEKIGAIYVMPKAQEKFQKIKDARASIVEQNENESNNEDDSVSIERYNLYIRLWSNAANIFLCDENDVIIDSFFRRPAKNEMSGQKFVLPIPKENTRDFEVREFSEIEERLLQEQKEKGFEKEITFNQKVDIFYSENATQTSLESLLEEAQKWYNSHKSRQVSALEKLQEKKNSFLNSDKDKHLGDLILSYSYLITENSNFIEVDDWETNEKVKIRIDPKKNAQENASIYYEKYKKAQSGLESLEHDILIAQKSIEELDKQYAEMIAEKNPIKLEQILRKKQTPRQLEKKAHPGLDYVIDGWQIIVGRDADENDELLRHNVKGMDMWMHVRDYHGGYVFIKNRPGKTVPLEILLYAGNLAVYYSKARKNGSADLYYTQVKHLRRAKNGSKGLVLPTNEKNIFIKLDEEKLRKLDEIQKGVEL